MPVRSPQRTTSQEIFIAHGLILRKARFGQLKNHTAWEPNHPIFQSCQLLDWVSQPPADCNLEHSCIYCINKKYQRREHDGYTYCNRVCTILGHSAEVYIAPFWNINLNVEQLQLRGPGF
jgi:hypothetical protein